MLDLPPLARFGNLVATGLTDVTSDPAALDSSGFWAVSADYEGGLVCARFADVRREAAPDPVPGQWRGPAAGDWTSSLDRTAYTAGVRRIREHIAAGEVYQANLCRVLSAPVAPDADVDALTALLARGNPAPYAGTIRLPGHGVEIATASPELFLRRDGRVVESGPIKGTGRTEADLLEKDYAENVMIVDLVRNDIGQVCATGSVTVPDLCVVEKHPGLVHLVSTVRGELREDTGWPELLAAAFPPGSVTGAPKSSALRIIDALETAPRGPYCGGIGWVDADRGTAELAVGIRTFWIDRTAGELRFGTGAGITWGSDPEAEWLETELKAARLLAVASGTYEASGRTPACRADPGGAASAGGSATGRTPGREDPSASGAFLGGNDQ
ncbi:chorismate-binding protein [Streptomyces ipomoeae]|uniref:Aminodeoxychorismate synthase, component I n=1 Tax=Streptomyces ipomoeae 91-03 TaxID=698759 RepID=L1KL13_9ACTN|nr:chorismate-binding protein [Streptomyces ipomoeae]EKX61501.1 aminodeoxychorismate synthase, component I [Streptomyces ipomoeae 91-03]MDX2699892.1 chorismate-binding protein [Streptomyces ipomoeae]MDX2840454.1 chorismate-binding protein [Streptomyces ipomoeae]MDX2932245.1 chorismate-binding protein [Streptomyces ipomoeae]